MTDDYFVVSVCRAFAMVGLAIASSKPREFATNAGIRSEPIKGFIAEQLASAVEDGSVTTIVESPQPFTFLITSGCFGEIRAIYGVWVGRKASWYGKRAPVKHVLQPVR